MFKNTFSVIQLLNIINFKILLFIECFNSRTVITSSAASVEVVSNRCFYCHEMQIRYGVTYLFPAITIFLLLVVDSDSWNADLMGRSNYIISNK